MNTPPTDGIRVRAEALHGLVYEIFAAVPIPNADARLIADLLIDTDLRGVVSHGVVQVERYFNDFRSGAANPYPQVRVLHEAASTAALTGDGGLGFVVGTRAMKMAMEKARVTGVGAVTTTYHAHVGSSGKYARMAMREDMIGISFSGHSAGEFSEEQMVNSSASAVPLAFGMPAGPDHPYLLCDFSSNMPFDEDFFARHPEIYFRGLGISHVANIMSGTLGGQMLEEFDRRTVKFTAATQSGFFMALRIENFVSVPAFKADMDKLMAGVSRMQPYPGFSEAHLPGGPEWQREREYARDGIPLSRQAVEKLERVAGEAKVSVPW